MVSAGSERGRRTGLAALGLGLGLLATMGASCRTRPDDCRHDSLERCTWEQAVNASAGAAEAGDEGDEADEAGEGDDSSGVTMSETERDELDATLDEMIEIMAGGLEWSLTDARARELCRTREADGSLTPRPVTVVTHDDDDPDPDPDPAEAKAKAKASAKAEASAPGQPEVWRCELDWLRINEVPLVLEASAGVISLSARGLAVSSSEAIAVFAQSRFDEWCARAFEELEGSSLDDIHRCDLEAGPYLVIARFPSDDELSSWQVSIAVVDAG